MTFLAVELLDALPEIRICFPAWRDKPVHGAAVRVGCGLCQICGEIAIEHEYQTGVHRAPRCSENIRVLPLTEN